MSIYYVATTGKDTNPGTQTTPFLTIQQGLSVLKPGDTLTIGAGTYAGLMNAWDYTISGTPTQQILIQADPAAPIGSVIINKGGLASGQTGPDGIDFEPGCNYITIKGLTISGSALSRSGIRIEQSIGVKILNCIVKGVQGFGIYTSHTTNVTVDSCTVSGVLGSGESGHGCYNSNNCVNATITNNTVHDNGGIGLHFNGDITQSTPGLVQNATITGNIVYNNAEVGVNCDGIQNSLIENNLIYNNARHGIALYQIIAGGPSKNNIIRNNTVDQVGTTGAALQLVNGATGNTVENNIFFGGANGDISISADSKSGLVSDYNIVDGTFYNYDAGTNITLANWKATGQDVHSIQSTPTLTLTAPTASTPDYSIKTGGPAISSGIPTGTNIGYVSASIIKPSGPAIVSQNILNGATGISINPSISLTFNENVIISKAVFTLINGTNSVILSSSYNSTTFTIGLTPPALVNGTTYTLNISGITDVNGVIMTAYTLVFTTMVSTIGQISLFPTISIPSNISENDTQAVEVGMIFSSNTIGIISAIKFYKGSTNTGTHVGHLWSSTGTLLSSVTFTNETASGWQTATLLTPISISSGVNYIVSYFAPKGLYSADSGYFVNSVTNGVLTAPSTNNGCYIYTKTAGVFPNQTFNNTNYWVDVVFNVQNANPQPAPTPFTLGLYTFPNGEPTAAQYKEYLRKCSYGDITGISGVPDGIVDIQDLNKVTSNWQFKVPIVSGN